jgi:hypothetical protein
MVEQLGKEEASKLIQSAASSSSGPSNLPQAGKPQVFEPSHPLGKDAMDWSEKSKRQAEQEEEQIKQLESEKLALQLQLEEIEKHERSLKSGSSKRPARQAESVQQVLGAKRSDTTYEAIAKEKRDKAAAASAARTKEEPSDEEFPASKPGAHTLYRTAEGRRKEPTLEFRGEPKSDKLTFNPESRRFVKEEPKQEVKPETKQEFQTFNQMVQYD